MEEVLVPSAEPAARKLTEQERIKVTEFINSKAAAPNDACAVCQSPHSLVAETAYTLSTLPADGALFSNQQMPLLATVCMECGFVRLFSEVVLRDRMGSPQLPGTRAFGEPSGN
jgi:hypothetical protein